ncbi:hypothetical protein QAD02_018447 [Eretmocerus hayati]|uniref:Uncharacterized protein n=1 Tax=Eretmocerus hayati TaxID=131215 RepID=A0ACC2PGV5_9HYME|nr:hypothetical protein QAD02_018447 [Eretmocerus hayati]
MMSSHGNDDDIVDESEINISKTKELQDESTDSGNEIEKEKGKMMDNPDSSSSRSLSNNVSPSPIRRKRTIYSDDSSSEEIESKKKKDDSESSNKSDWLPVITIPFCEIPIYVDRLAFEVKIKSKSSIEKTKYPKGKSFELELLDEFNTTKAKVFNDDCEEIHEKLGIIVVFWNDQISRVNEKMKGQAIVLHNVKMNLYDGEKKLFFFACSRIDTPETNK